MSANAGANRYNAAVWSTAGINLNDYFEFTLTPNVGFKINLSSLVYTGESTATGPTSFEIRTSIDSYSSNVGSPVEISNNINLTAAAYQNLITAITFRIYAFDGFGSAGTYSINPFTFNGTVIPTTPVIPVITSTLTISNIKDEVATPYTITANNFATSYNATGLPSGLTINTITGVISGTPTAAAGPYNVTITATNSYGTDSEILVYTLTPQTCSNSGDVIWSFTAGTAAITSNGNLNLITVSDISRGNN